MTTTGPAAKPGPIPERHAMSTETYQLTTEDGTVLTSATDLGLAWEWAEHAHGPEAWAALSYGQQCQEAAAALDGLRAANQ